MAIVVDEFTWLTSFSNPTGEPRWVGFNNDGTTLSMAENDFPSALQVQTRVTDDGWLSNSTTPNVTLGSTLTRSFYTADGRYVAVIDDGGGTYTTSLVTTQNNWQSSTTTTLENNQALRAILSGDGRLILYINGGSNLWRIALRQGDSTSTTYTTQANLGLTSTWAPYAWVSHDGTRIVILSADVNTLRVYQVDDVTDWTDTPPFTDHAITIAATAVLGALNANRDVTALGVWVDDSKTSKVAVLATPDDWTTVNEQNLANTNNGGMFGNGRFMAVANTTSEVTVYETDDNWATTSIAQVINQTTFPEVGATFNPFRLIRGNPGGNYEFLAIPSAADDTTHVFEVPHVVPPPPSPTPTPVDPEVLQFGPDNVLGLPPSDLSVTALELGPRTGLVTRDAYYTTVRVGQPSPVIGSVAKDASFSSLGVQRLV